MKDEVLIMLIAECYKLVNLEEKKELDNYD